MLNYFKTENFFKSLSKWGRSVCEFRRGGYATCNNIRLLLHGQSNGHALQVAICAFSVEYVHMYEDNTENVQVPHATLCNVLVRDM